MNGEAILDAMNYLDDDLITATGKIRHREKKSYLFVLAAAAACLCLLLIPQYEKSFAPTESVDNAYSGLTDRYYGDTKAEAPAENAVEAPAGGADHSMRGFTATVCVLELRDDAFVGSITNNADGGVQENEEIVIQCDASVLADLNVGDILWIQYWPGESNTLLEYKLVTDHE